MTDSTKQDEQLPEREKRRIVILRDKLDAWRKKESSPEIRTFISEIGAYEYWGANEHCLSLRIYGLSDNPPPEISKAIQERVDRFKKKLKIKSRIKIRYNTVREK